MYLIKSFLHRTDNVMGAHGFCIDLHPSTKKAVLRSGITQEKVDNRIEALGRHWLDAVGYNAIFDPDNCGHEADPKAPPGSNAHPLYEPRTSLRVSWGEWGPEHITVPGNACGLDLSGGSICCWFEGGQQLTPHNVDSLRQKYLLTVLFTDLMEWAWLVSKLPTKGSNSNDPTD